MINTRTFATCALGLVLLTHGVDGQAVSQYRNFELGVNVAAVSVLTGLATSEAKTIHERPALLQDLEWRPSHWRSSDRCPRRIRFNRSPSASTTIACSGLSWTTTAIGRKA